MIDGEGRYEIRASGHSQGNPVVCGVVSATIQGLASTLSNAGVLGIGASDVYVSMKSGNALVKCKGGSDVKALFDLVYITLAQVSMAEPESLEVLPPT